MTRAILVVGWICLALDAFGLVAMSVGRGSSSEAAGSGLGKQVALLLAQLSSSPPSSSCRDSARGRAA